MSNFTNSIAATSHMKPNFVIIFQKLFEVICFIKIYLSQNFPWKQQQPKLVGKTFFLLAATPIFLSNNMYIYIYIYIYYIYVCVYIYIYIYIYIYMVFITEGFFEVAIENWSEWELNLRPLNSVQTL